MPMSPTYTEFSLRVLNSLRQQKHRAIEALMKVDFIVSTPQIKLIIIGAQKGGTTALYHYLSEHPDIDVPNTKETNFFSSCTSSTPRKQDYLKNFPRRFRWSSPFYSIDTSPSYLLEAKRVASKIHAYDSEIKLAAILREPVSRAVSSWFMYKKLASANPDWFMQSGWVKNNNDVLITRRKQFGSDFASDIDEEIEVLNNGNRIEFPIVEYGLYAQQLACFYEYFNKSSIEIIFSDELKTSTQTCLNSLCDLSEIKRFELTQKKLVPHFVGDNKADIPEQSLVALRDYYRTENQKLSELLGLTLPWSDA